MKKQLLHTVLVTFFAVIACSPSAKANAGCTGVCISTDSTGTFTVTTLDTIGIANGSVDIYAYYNGACSSLMQSNNVALAWYRNGIPFDTTDANDAVFDGVWTYKTTLNVSQPGLYTVYFLNFVGPNFQCRSVLVNDSTAISTTGIKPETAVAETFRIYPNPVSLNGATAPFVVRTTSGITITRVNMFDLQGKTIAMNAVITRNGETTVAAPDAGAGIYVIEIETASGQRFRQKLVIEK